MSKNLRFTLLGLFAIMLTFGFTVRAQSQCTAELTTYGVTVNSILYDGIVDTDAKTVAITVPYGTFSFNSGNMDLIGTFSLTNADSLTHSEDAQEIQVSGTTMNDFLDPVAFTVHQGAGPAYCTVEYFVTVTEGENACNDITSIDFESFFRDCYRERIDVTGSFTRTDDAWELVVPHGTRFNHGSRVLDITVEDCGPGATIDPLPENINFSNNTPVTVTVTAPNGVSQRVFTLTMSRTPASDAHLLIDFGLEVDGEVVAGIVDESTHRVDVVLPFGTDVTALTACYTTSDWACFYKNGPELTDKTLQNPCDDDDPNVNDYTDPTHFTVVAQDGISEDTYNVVVTFVDPDTDNSLSDLVLDGLTDCNGYSIDPVVTELEGVYTIRLREGMDEGVEFAITYLIPELATSVPMSPIAVTFVDGVAVPIVVTAEDGTPATYTLMPEYVAPSTLKAITEFGFDAVANTQFNQTYLGVIDEEAKTITVNVPFGSTVDALKASFILDDEFASMTHSEENGDLQVPQMSGMSAINYVTPAAFTVFAEDCSTVEYFVTVVIDENGGNDIESLTADGSQDSSCGCDPAVDVVGDVSMTGTDITVTVPYETDLASLVIDGVLTEGATTPDLPVTGYTDPFDVVVTAEDGLATKTYTVTVVFAEASDANMLLTFGFLEDFNTGLEHSPVVADIDEVKNRIDVQVAYGTPVATLVPTFTKSEYACVYMNGEQWTAADIVCTDVTVVDFSTYQTLTVVAQNGDEAYYNVYVEVLPPSTENALTNLMVNDLPECFGDFTYDVTGMMDDMNFTVSVKNGTDVSAVDVSFDIPMYATVDPMPGVWDLTSPVTVTVTAQSGDEAVYTVTAVERAINSAKMITSYAIGNSTGTIDQTNKVIEVWVPWLTDVSALVADFTLSDGATMTHSEDTWFLQESGVTANDFTTPVAYTVWAEDCTTLEYFVIVRITPNTNTSISQFVIDFTGCFCDDDASHFRIDNFAKRIYVQIPYADENGQAISLSSLDVLTIGIADGASVSPGAGTQNFSNGPVTYVVTAPDGVTKVAWEVFVENPPCTGANILDWTFEGDVQVGDAVIDAAAHTINVTLVPGTSLEAMLANTVLDCGATICCSAGNCAGTAIDFSVEGNCHTCVVTAQDKSITQDWTICVEVADVVKPEAFTNSVLAHNCADSVMVWGDKDGGTIYIVDELTADAISELVNAWTTSITTLAQMEDWLAMNEEARDMIEDAMDAHMAASAGYPYADSLVSIMTDGIYSGLYYAVLVDAAGNVSCASEEAVFIDQCVVTVADLCALRDGSPVYMYVVEGEVLVSYEEGNFKFVQDASCGIKVVDNLDAWPATFGVGQGLTNIKGTIDKTGNEYVFNPVCCYAPDKSSSGNVIAPVELTWDEFVANCYSHYRGYESMLVKITDPMLAFDDYGLGYTTWELDYLDLATVDARGNYEWFIQKDFNTNYIGNEIPTEPTIYQGIRTNVEWSSVYGLITPRSTSDIIAVTAGILIADPDPVSITGVTPGACGSATVTIINQGVGNLTISALYLDDAVGTDEFELIDPAQVPFTLGTWESMDVQVDFCPTNAGGESTTLLVEYGDGKVMEVPINGETVLIVEAPYCTNFNNDTPGSTDGWKSTNMIYGGQGYNFGTGQMYYYGWSWVTPNSASPVILESPGFDLTDVTNATLTWWSGTYFSSNLRVDVSTDKVNWTVLRDLGYFTNGNAVGKQFTADLSAYDGQVVFLRWYSTGANYYSVDDVCIDQKVTDPIFAVTPNPGDFGGVQVGETADVTFTVTNTGVSVLNVKKVEMVAGSEFVLTDDNTYPAEVTNELTYAFTKNGTSSVAVTVSFSPSDIGIYSGKLLITYGLYSDKVVEVPFSGEGLSCATATEAFVGENWAPGQNIWFTYTAEKFQIVNINSCHPFNTVDPYEYSFDTYMYIYDDCDGNLIAENDDLEWDACPYNRASSGAVLAMNEGETVKIFFPWVFDSASDDIGFYLNIEPSYPIDGDVCETAIPLTLPVVNHFGSTVTFEDDYDMSPCSPYSNYMDGNDKVYSITLDVEGYLTVNILGAYGSVHVLDECPVEELEKRNCKAFASGPNGGEVTKRIQPGTYYVIVSTWAPPQTVDYLLNMSFEELSTGVDGAGLGSSLVVYPNPTQGMFTVSISNAEASDLTLELVNISGQTVYRNEVKSVYSYNEEIDASSFAKGVYYLKVNDGEEVKIEKVVIQ